MNTNEERKRTTRLTRAVLSVISALMLFSLLVLFTFAADSTSPYDAQFGELYYENLSDAIEAANSSASGGTVTVLRDVNLAECLTISKDVTLMGKYTIYRADSYTAGLFTVDAGVTLTLDGGITLDGGNEWVLDYDAFHTDIQKEEFLVSGMSYVTAEPSAPVATAHMISIYGSLVMNKATVQNNYGGTSLTTAPFRLYQGATLTMNDGAVARHNYIKGDSALVHCNSRYATWTINDGAEITENYSTGVGGLSFFYYSYVEMNGGEMHDNYVCGKEGSIFKLYNGARFTMNDGYIHDNYAFAMSGQWGGTISVHYTSDAATTGNYSTFTMNGGVVGPNYGNGQTTLVGNGYNKPCLYLNGGKVINVDGYNGASGSYLYYTADSGVMDGGTIEGDSVDIRKDFTNNGTINSNVYLINKANATVYGNGVVNGNLYLDPDKNTVSACISGCTWNGDVILSDIANAVLSGGTYNGNIIVPDGATLSITGGQFKNSPVEYLAAGSQSFYDAETGLYTVYSGNVASFGGAEYATLAEAIAAANAVGGGEVSLLRSTYISEQIDVSSNITLTGDYIISRAKAPLENYTGTLFNVSAGATLTLDGGITVDGGNNWVLDEEQFYANLDAGTNNLTNYAIPESGAPVASDYMFKISGTLIMNSATVKNHYQGIEKASIFSVSSTGHLSLNSGSVLTHNASAQNRTILTIAAPGTLEINPGSLISYNHADAATAVNGGLFWISSDAVINGGEFCYNTFAGDSGNLFIIHNSSSSVEATLTMNGGWMHHNASLGDAGYLIYIHKEGGGGKFYMYDGLIEENRAVWVSAIGSNGSGKNEMYLMGGTLNQIDSSKDHSGYWRALHNEIGENMTINGGSLHVRRPLINNGTLNTDLYLQMRDTAYPVIVSGSGVVTGDLYVLPYAANPSTEVIIQSGTYLGNLIVSNSDCLSITGGLFKNDPSAYLADCYEAVYDEASGFYTVKKYYEASFGGVDYVTLEEAIAAANTAGGGTVTLLHDVDLDSSITLSSDILLEGAYSVVRSDSYTGNLFTVDADCTLTLDGGITIDGGNEWVLDYDALYACMMANGANIDSNTFLTAEAGAPKATTYAFNINGHLVMNSATVKNHYASNDTASVFYIAGGASLTMNSGAVATHNGSDKNKTVVNCAANGDWIINDGADISYNSSATGNGSVAWITGRLTMNGGEVHHNTQRAGAGGFVIVYGGGLFTMNGGSINENTSIVAAGTVAGIIYVYDGTKFVMNGGVIEKNYSNGNTGIYAKAATSSLELNAGIIRQELRATAPTGYTGLASGPTYIGEDMLIEGGVFRFSKGDFVMDGTMICDVQIRKFSDEIDINGTIDGDVSIDGSITTTISGGNWLGQFVVAEGSALSITGGLFKNDPSAYLADYYEAVYDEASGFYTVNKYYEASFDGVNYDSLEEAIAAANTAGGGTVTLIHDVDLDSSITVSSDILLEGAYSVVRSDSYTGNLFTVEAGATLTLDGGITVDGGNEWTIDYELLNECMLANGSTSVATSFVTPEAGAPVATDYMFNISGSVIMNNAIVKNNYQTTGEASPFYVASGATLIMNDGAVATHNCSFGGNSVARISSGAEWVINEGAEVSYNHAEGGNGGVAYVYGHVIMNGGEVHHNTLYTGAGSFLILHTGGKLTMNDGSIHDNTNVIIGNVTSATIYVHGNGTFIMNGGVIEKNLSNRTSTVYAYASTSVVELNAGIIRHEDNTVTSAASSYFAGRTVIGENVVIDGGIIRFYKVTDYKVDGQLNCELQLARTTADLNIGGTLNGRLLVYDSSNITVTGGTYLGGFKIYSGVTFKIEGGSFRENPTDWTAEGYHPVYSKETELYTVILTPVASIDGAKYDTLAEAVAAAEDGDVINVIASHKLADSVTIDKAVTVDMKNQTITLSPAAAVAFVIEAEATFRGDGTVNTDNGNSKVFVIGSESTAGSLTIEDGSYIGESTVAAVENGSLNITGGDFAVNPDVAEGETADHSALLTVSESANTSVAITGGRFRSFNPESAGGGYLGNSHDAAEESGDYYNVLAHLFEHYVSDGNATCTADGTKTAKCKYCELTDTITEVGTKLQHVFLHYISDGNATCTEDGTRTAKCEGCDVTFTIPDTRSALGHSFTDYKSNGDATCKANGTRTAKCDHCDETRTIMEAGTKLPHTYEGLTCTACGNLRIWLIAVIIFCCVGLLMFLPLMII